MKANIKPCIKRHLVERAKGGNTVPPGDWFDTADAHLVSVAAIINTDPNGAIILTWAAMHKIGKGLAATGGYRLQDETHGKHSVQLGPPDARRRPQLRDLTITRSATKEGAGPGG